MKVYTLYNLTFANESLRVPFIFHGQSVLWDLGSESSLGDSVQTCILIDERQDEANSF